MVFVHYLFEVGHFALVDQMFLLAPACLGLMLEHGPEVVLMLEHGPEVVYLCLRQEVGYCFQDFLKIIWHPQF